MIKNITNSKGNKRITKSIKHYLILCVLIINIMSLSACGVTEDDIDELLVETGHEDFVIDTENNASSSNDIPIIIDNTEASVTTNEEINVVVDLEVPNNTSDINNTIPEYSGNLYVELNNNIPNLSKDDGSDVFELYSDMDNLGRCGVAYANICKEIMPTEERGEIGHIRPSGWHTVKYNGVVDGNYLYNRCHLIAYCLAGENDNEKNLITGTRQFNVEGMLPFETKVANYVDRTNHHVLYRVTPIYDGDNLVAKGVQIEALSIEDDEICFNVFVYNVQNNIHIDYATGESYLLDSTETDTTEIITTESLENTEQSEEIYILNTNSMKIHKSSCDSVKDIKEHNKQESSEPLTNLEDMGYTKCKRCF